MSYADDLAKDRDKYLLQRNQLMGALRDLLDNGSVFTRQKARDLLAKIDKSDPIANMVDAD